MADLSILSIEELKKLIKYAKIEINRKTLATTHDKLLHHVSILDVVFIQDLYVPKQEQLKKIYDDISNGKTSEYTGAGTPIAVSPDFQTYYITKYASSEGFFLEKIISREGPYEPSFQKVLTNAQVLELLQKLATSDLSS